MTGVKIRSFTPLLGGWASNRRPNRAAAATRDLPVLMISAATGAGLLDRARAGGATALLRKPFALAELLAEIARAVP